MGKSIIVPHFGTFTFSNPLSLNGVTNPKIHDRQSREPIFLVSKHFLNGKNLACGMSTENNLRILAQTSINNNYQLVKCNYTEIALYCDYSKDIARVCCERVFRELEDQIRNVYYLKYKIKLFDFSRKILVF